MRTRPGFRLPLGLLLVGTLCLGPAWDVAGEEEPTRVVLLPPGPGNPRNSEGDFIRREDGRILLVYTHCAGNRKTTGGLASTQITRFPLEWLYK